MGPTLEAIVYSRGQPLKLLNQLLLPTTFSYDEISTVKETWEAIRSMKVRGAPAIAIAGMLGIAVELQCREQEFVERGKVKDFLSDSLQYILTSRPTAVNLQNAVKDMQDMLKTSSNMEDSKIIEAFIDKAEAMQAADIRDNENISDCGSEHIIRTSKQEGRKLRVLTHCNTGSLATVKYGTALGVVRYLHKKGMLERVYCTETRPYRQGARLSTFEMHFEKIPVSLIVDSAVSYLMATKQIDAVVVGADRVCENGDTANKIGTLQLAVAAKHFDVPFYVASPMSSVDLTLASGEGIPVEERDSTEITHDTVQLPSGEPYAYRRVVDGVDVWNPSFDVTPASLIAGIFTEKGVVLKQEGCDQYKMSAQ